VLSNRWGNGIAVRVPYKLGCRIAQNSERWLRKNQLSLRERDKDRRGASQVSSRKDTVRGGRARTRALSILRLRLLYGAFIFL